MTNYKILLGAIKKAKANGWNQLYKNEYPDISAENLADDIDKHTGGYRKLLFQHEFAKAFWGEQMCDDWGTPWAKQEKETRGMTAEIWQIRLKEIVLESKPLKYLSRFL